MDVPCEQQELIYARNSAELKIGVGVRQNRPGLSGKMTPTCTIVGSVHRSRESFMLSSLLFVILGGGLGAGLRLLVATYVTRRYGGPFPLGTVLINVTGSFCIGILMTLFLNKPGIPPVWRLFLVTGFLGGFTTFSSFEWETLAAWKGGSPMVALANVFLSVALGFVGVWLGFFVMNRFRGH